jgi:hypothetical protein
VPSTQHLLAEGIRLCFKLLSSNANQTQTSTSLRSSPSTVQSPSQLPFHERQRKPNSTAFLTRLPKITRNSTK